MLLLTSCFVDATSHRGCQIVKDFSVGGSSDKYLSEVSQKVLECLNLREVKLSSSLIDWRTIGSDASAILSKCSF